MSRPRATIGLLSSRRAAIAFGVLASAVSFVVAWMLLVPHMEAIGGVYRLAANLPPPAADGPVPPLAVPAAGIAAFLAGVAPRLIRGKRRAN